MTPWKLGGAISSSRGHLFISSFAVILALVISFMWQILFKIGAVILLALCENQNVVYQYFDLMFSKILPPFQTYNDVETLKKLLHCSYVGFGKVVKLF